MPRSERKASKAGPSRGPQELVQHAMRVHQQGQTAEAVATYRRVLEAAPDNVDALHFLGIAEHQQGRSEEALALLARAIDLAPNHPDPHVNRGHIMSRLGRVDEAEKCYVTALSLRPEDPKALLGLATLLRGNDRHEEAVALLRVLVDLEPGHADAHQALTESLCSLGRLDEAIEAGEKAIRIRPSASLFRRLGAFEAARGRVTEAAERYRQWLSLEPDHPEAKHLLAGCTSADAPARASDAFVRSLFDRFAPTFDRSLARLQYRAPELVAGAVASALGDPVKALDILDVGCGTGLCGGALRAYARNLVGVDLSRNMLELADARHLYDFLVEGELGDMMSRNPDSFDVIVSADTLVYFGALEQVMDAAALALREGGLLAFTTERSTEAAAPGGVRLHSHGRYSHTEAYVRRVLGGAGLEALEVREVDLRKEAGEWVGGLLVTARRRPGRPG